MRILVFCFFSLSSSPPWLLIVMERTYPSWYSQATADFPSASVMTTPRPFIPSIFKGEALFNAATLSKLLDPSPGTPIADAVCWSYMISIIGVGGVDPEKRMWQCSFVVVSVCLWFEWKLLGLLFIAADICDAVARSQMTVSSGIVVRVLGLVGAIPLLQEVKAMEHATKSDSVANLDILDVWLMCFAISF